MKKIDVVKLLNSDNAASREDARLLLDSANQEVLFDFSNINFVSGAFADELITNLSDQTVEEIKSSAPEHVAKMFDAVQRRYANILR